MRVTSTGDRQPTEFTPSTPWYQDLHVLGALSSACVLLAALAYPLWGGVFEILCPLRELTGIPCPTCYGTRAMVALMAGNWGAALRFNPLVAVGGIGLMLYVPWGLGTAWAGRGRVSVPASMVTASAWAAGLSVAVNWAYLITAHA